MRDFIQDDEYLSDILETAEGEQKGLRELLDAFIKSDISGGTGDDAVELIEAVEELMQPESLCDQLLWTLARISTMKLKEGDSYEEAFLRVKSLARATLKHYKITTSIRETGDLFNENTEDSPD